MDNQSTLVVKQERKESCRQNLTGFFDTRILRPCTHAYPALDWVIFFYWFQYLPNLKTNTERLVSPHCFWNNLLRPWRNEVIRVHERRIPLSYPALERYLFFASTKQCLHACQTSLRLSKRIHNEDVGNTQRSYREAPGGSSKAMCTKYQKRIAWQKVEQTARPCISCATNAFLLVADRQGESTGLRTGLKNF